MIPIFAGQDVRSYLAAEETGRLRLPRVCTACGSRLWGHGCYERGSDETGPQGYRPVSVRRRRCRQCRRKISSLPCFLGPYQGLVSALRQCLYQGRRLARKAWAEPEAFEAVSWRGVVARVGGDDIMVASSRLLEEYAAQRSGHQALDTPRRAEGQREWGRMVIFVAPNRCLVGAVALADQVKPQATVFSPLPLEGRRVTRARARHLFLGT